MAKVASLAVKAGAVAFIIVLSPQFSVNLQLLGGVWILQTFPAIMFGLYTRFFHRWALLSGWLAGMVTGTWMAYATPNVAKHQAHFGGSVYNWHFLGHFKAYPGFIALCINVAVVLVLTLVFMLLRVPKGADATTPDDFATACNIILPFSGKSGRCAPRLRPRPEASAPRAPIHTHRSV